ncbi:MAG: TolC family protein [Bacteroidetes bacterium]|nr:TolC family protein [Bacteroidota bacterium]
MKKYFLILLFVTYSGAIAGEKIIVNLNESIKIALESNHKFKQAKLEYQKAKEQVWEAYGSSLFPSIDGTVTYSRAIQRPRFIIETPFFSGSFPAGSKNTMTASINVEQPLFTGAIFLAVRIAETFAEISKQSKEYSESELIVQVKQAYYTCLLADGLVELAELQLKRAEENLNNTRSMYKAGLVSEYDYIKANVQYQNTLPALTEAKNQKNLALNNFKLILGLDLKTTVDIEGELKYSKFSEPDYEEGILKMYNQNQLIKQMELQVEMQDLIKSYQFTDHLPTLTAFGNWQSQAQEEDVRSFDNWRYFNSLAVGLTLRVPIFNGFTTISKTEQAELDLKVAVEGLANTKKAVINEYENSILQIKKTEEQISAYEAAVLESERGYEIAQKRFESGLGTQLEVTDALVGATNARLNLLTTLHDYYLNHARMDLIVGKKLNEIIN